MSMTDLANLTGLGWDTIKRIVKGAMTKEAAEVDLKQVKFLAIDEVYLGKLHKFITIVIDWESGQVLYVAKGRRRERPETLLPSASTGESRHPRHGD